MRILPLRRSVVPAVVAALFLTTFAFLASPQPAAAHDALVSSDPAADSTIEVVPAAMTLTFSAAPMDEVDATAVQVLDATGASVTAGAPSLDGAVLTQPLLTTAAAGEYRVIWRVLSGDGHPISGEFAFTAMATSMIEAPPVTAEPTTAPADDAAPAPTTEATADAPTPDAESAAETSFSPAWIVAAIVAVILLGVLAAMFVLHRRRRADDTDSDDASER